MIKQTKEESIFNVINIIVTFLIVVITIYPCWHVLVASFSDSALLMQHGGFLITPLGFSLTAYSEVFQNRLIGTGYINTIINLFFTVIISMSITILGAYALSRKELMLRRPIMLLITFTMFFSGGLIPNYLLVRDLGMVDTRWALIIPTAVSAYNLIIMRTSFEALPESLIESAKLDGANSFTVLLRIVVPISTSIIAAISLFYAVTQWNSWFPAFIYLTERETWPLQMVLREIVIANNMDEMLTGVDPSEMVAIGESIRYATIVVATIPILLVYPFLQKYFVKGVMIGAVKG